MGFERHSAALFLKLRANGIKFGHVLTLGRQHIALELEDYCRVLERIGRPRATAVPQFADDLLLNLGAKEVVAMDCSDYEGARVVHDLNEPVSAQWHEQYDLVFDGGTLEHIFNFPNAIKNCMQMLRHGGRFISISNNWCGHGFYQFSPELFYRIFSSSNGFSVVEMYVAEVRGRVYGVKDPAILKSRVELCNRWPVHLLVHARRDTVRTVFAQTPQQSDYVVAWSASPIPPSTHSVNGWRNLPGIKQLRKVRRNFLLRKQFRSCSLGNRRFYTPVDLRI